VPNVGNTCEMVNFNVLNDVSKCYYVAEMDEIKYQYQYQSELWTVGLKTLPFQPYLFNLIKFYLSGKNWLAPSSNCFYPQPKQVDSATFIAPASSIAFAMHLKWYWFVQW
jgi:hypothetical protein